MVFNWFRREHNDAVKDAVSTDKQDDKAVSEKSTNSESPTEKSSEPTLDLTKDLPPKDLLSWAKTAYANIQAREDVGSIEITNPEKIDDVANAEVVTEQILSGNNSEETPLPFWADSDRKARIAELNANAITEVQLEQVELEIPESEAIITAKEIEVTEELDAGFLWSAEILAAQGRRPEDISVDEIAWLKRLRQGLDKTRLNLVNQLKSLVGKGPLNAEAVDEIEALLLQADVGVVATDLIIKKLQAKIKNEVLPPDLAIAFLKQLLQETLELPLKQHKNSPRLAPEKNQLNVWLITGINGAGKTTTIGKLAHLAKNSGYSTLIAAADTFRAAAVQQVQVWGDRSGVDVIANIGKNTDPAAVVFDAISAAQSRGTELLLVDTAGRLQNKQNLMDELSKIRRIVDKKAVGAKIESLLVLDATLGQNGLKQAEVFSKSAGISGVILTKLDGTAKGGVAIAVVQQLGLPIRFIGAGEGINDLRPFSSYEFVEALLSNY